MTKRTEEELRKAKAALLREIRRQKLEAEVKALQEKAHPSPAKTAVRFLTDLLSVDKKGREGKS